MREVFAYLAMVAATLVLFACVPFASAAICRRYGRGKRCAAVSAVALAFVGLPVWATLMQRVAPLQSFLGSAGWAAVLAVPVAAMMAAGLIMLWRGPDRRWYGIEVRRAVFGVVLCGVVGLGMAWRSNDRLFGWGIAMSGCGIVRGTVDFLAHQEAYRRLWWGDVTGWAVLDCAAELDRSTAEGLPDSSPAGGSNPGSR